MKTDLKEFLQAKITCILKHYRPKCDFRWPMSISPLFVSSPKESRSILVVNAPSKTNGSCKIWSNFMGLAVLFILVVIDVLQS